MSVLIALAAAAFANNLPSALRGAHRVMILGDSITYAGGYADAIDAAVRRAYPKTRLQFINIGLPSETVSGLTERNHAGGAFPRPDLHERLARALKAVHPDVVLACYGMNDGIYAPLAQDRFAKFQAGIQWLKTEVEGAHARFWLATPPPFDPVPIRASLAPAGLAEYPSGKTYEGYDEVLAAYTSWILSQKSRGWNVIDIHSPIKAYLAAQRQSNPSFSLSGDGVHLNETGHLIIAREVLKAWKVPEAFWPTLQPELPGRDKSAKMEFERLVHLRQRILTDAWLRAVGHKRPGMAPGMPLAEAEKLAADLDRQIETYQASIPPQVPGPVSDYHGYDRHDLKVDGLDAIIVSPHSIVPGDDRPWIWRAEFFDHRPELDLALLAKGYHLVYIGVGNTFGAPSAMRHWDAFYRVLTHTYGLSRHPVLEGLSRGGLYIYNWAARHPEEVGVLYGDNPVCDFKSWPGGKGKGPGSPEDWKKLISDYGFQSEAAAMAYRLNPVDNLAPLAKAHVPIIHCAADADEVVPYEENTVILKQRYEALGGEIKVIVKHGFRHHPHGLDDPTPIVDFIESQRRRG